MNAKIVIYFLMCALLSGCIGVVAIGAAGGLAVYDRRSISMIEKDARNFYVINRGLANNRAFRDSHVTITSYNEVVVLSGEVTSDTLKDEALNVAKGAPNVRRVYNELTVGSPTSLLTRSRDSFIASKIRAKMLTQRGLESGSIRIVIEDGRVYLMGVVTHEQADLAVNVAKEVNGVQQVIKIFQYIT